MDAPPSTACTQRLHRDWTFLFLSAVKQVSTPQFLRLPLRSSRAARRLERRGASESIPQSLGPAGWRPQAKSGEVNGFSWRTAWNDSVVEFFLEVNRFSWKLYNLGLFFSLFLLIKLYSSRSGRIGGVVEEGGLGFGSESAPFLGANCSEVTFV